MTEEIISETEAEIEKEAEKDVISKNKWYIINAVVGFENKAAELIKKEADKKNISHLIEEIIVPVEVVTEVRKGKKVDVNKKILPGYILIKMDLTDEVWNMVKNIKFVAKFLGASHKPMPVPQREIDTVINKIKEVKEVKKIEDIFEIGEIVMIMEGAFESFSAAIEDVDREKKTLKVSVSIFGRETPLELTYDQVKKIVEK